MTYTNEKFREDLQGYLDAKKAKHAARSERSWFFRTVCSDPHYQAKVDFVASLIRKIDRGEHDRVERWVQRGLEGQKGFRYSALEVSTSNLCNLLFLKSQAIAEERAGAKERKSQDVVLSF